MTKETSTLGIIYDSTPFSEKVPDAGVFPFRSGIHQGMYKTKPWTIRQYSGFGNPEEANQRLKHLIRSGVTGLSIAFDLPTQMGLDPDNELARAEVGKVGVSVSNLEDMRRLLDGIDISSVSTSMTINATAPILLLMYQIIAEERGIAPESIRGTIQNDILKEYISRGTYIFPPSKSLELCAETVIYCNKNLPNWNPISISGYHMSEAGATAVHEVAFAFANAIEYLKEIIEKGMKIDEIAPRLSFFFSSRLTLLEEVSKFRAAREVWAKIVKDQFGAENPKSWHLRFHSQTAGVELIAQNPELNVVRVTLQALGAILGGTQSLHTNAFDEAISLPSDNSARIALQTQQIIMEETGLTQAIDPFRGSYLVENMTNQMIGEIEAELNKINKIGGALKGIYLGYQQDQIEANSYLIARRIEENVQKIVGLNFSVVDADNNTQTEFKLSSTNAIIENFITYKENRNTPKVEIELKKLHKNANLGNELMQSIRDCLVVGASIGEICTQLSEAWTTYKKI